MMLSVKRKNIYERVINNMGIIKRSADIWSKNDRNTLNQKGKCNQNKAKNQRVQNENQFNKCNHTQVKKCNTEMKNTYQRRKIKQNKRNKSEISNDNTLKLKIGYDTFKQTIKTLNDTPKIRNYTSKSINDATKRVMQKMRSVRILKFQEVQQPKLNKYKSQTAMNRKHPIQNGKMLFHKMKLKKNSLKINDFKLGKKLGNGRFGNVFMAEQKYTGSIYAIKIFNKQRIKSAGMQSQIIQQIKLQSYMNHPNILKLYGICTDTTNVYLIMQYCEQCLFRSLRFKQKLTQQETALYIKQTITALKYMHNQYIIHRDIKPQNILINFNVIKIADFGWSVYSPVLKRLTFCGTVDYVSPQIIQGQSYDQNVDVWAVGVLLFELCSGYAPFETDNQNNTYNRILYSQVQYPEFMSNEMVSVIRTILTKSPENRSKLQGIEESDWFVKYKTVGRKINKNIWDAWLNLSELV